MAFQLKPTWLLDDSRLQEIVKHHLFLPQDIPTITTLQDSAAFLNGMKSFLFWKGQLSPSLTSNMIYLAFLGPQGLQDPDIINVTLALKDVIDLTKITEFYRGADTHFFALSFASKEPVTQILSHFKFYNDAIVLAVTHDDVPQHRFKLLWLPPLFDVARVHHVLHKHTLSHRLRRESIPIADGKFTPTNVVSGVLTLKPGTQPSSLPYLIQLPSPHKGCALLTIEGRAPLCLKCREIGHTRQQCAMKKCVKCLKVHFPSSTCGVSSYSSVASHNITLSSDDDWLGHLCDNDSNPSTDVTTIHPLESLNLNNTSLPDISSSSIPPTSPDLPLNTSQDLNQAFSKDDNNDCDRPLPVSTSITPHNTKLDNTTLPRTICTPNLPSKTDLPINSQTLDPRSASPISTSVSSSSTTITTNQSQPVSSSPNHDQRLASSKVLITEKPSLASAARSHIITYSTAPSTSSAIYLNKTSSFDSDHTGYLFGDPDPKNTFSSNSDSDSDFSTKMDTSDVITHQHSSRKRKVLHHFDHQPTLEAASRSSSPSLLPPPANTSIKDVDTFLQATINSPTSELPTYTPRTPIFLQVSLILGADDPHTAALESICPNGRFTPDIVKILRLLYVHGFNIDAILSFPQILIIQPTELREKIKFLQLHQGTFTLADIWTQGRIEAKAFFTSPPTGIQHP